MDSFLQKCNLTETDQKVIKEKESDVLVLLAASDEKLREKQIPEKIIQLVVTGRKSLSLEECRIIWKDLSPYGK